MALKPERIDPVGAPPVSLEEVKAHLFVAHDHDDASLRWALEVAAAMIAKAVGPLTPERWRASFACFAPHMLLRVGPAQSLEAATYFDRSGAAQPLDLAQLRLEARHGGAAAVLIGDAPATQSRPDAVSIEYRAFHGETPEQTPQPLRHAVLLLAGEYYRHREASAPAENAPLIFGVRALIDPYRGRFL